ncbi:MAG: iron-containing alcohol dehydrogenase, partial [Chania sp.]
MTTSLMITNRQTWFGNGSIQQLIPLLQTEPQATLLFTCRSFINSPIYSSLADALMPLLVGSEVVTHEASPQEIDAWVARWRGKVKRVVAIGGGSVLDAAKAFAAIIEHPLPTRRYMEKIGDCQISGATLPVIAIPTTAGTGSEATQNAVITDTQLTKVKASLRHPNFVPQVAILDPELLKGAPDNVLVYCGIDAFTHLLESYLSKTASSMSRAMSLAGLQHFLSAWPMLKHSDEARAAIMQASYL